MCRAVFTRQPDESKEEKIFALNSWEAQKHQDWDWETVEMERKENRTKAFKLAPSEEQTK